MITTNDKDFLLNALNAYWNEANNQLQKKGLGDIERENYEYQLSNSKRLMDTLEQKLNIASVVRPEVGSAKEGELLPASDGEANTCADWKVKCHKCGKGFEKVTDLWGHLNSPCA